jgi:serine/threonine protein kinase
MPEAPQKIGKYEVRGLVGKGAMGVVYNAVDPALGRAVAIKTLSLAALSGSPHEAEMRLRFLREARSAGMLQHPNIITVHELFEEGGTAYLVMELLEGASLASLLKRKKELTLGERLSIVDQIAAGLSEAHAHRIIHRDLKPSNVFIGRTGVAKVLDFGVAKMGEGELTKAGTVFGTVEYMAPEQVRGASVNARADIFSLGVLAYETLSGRNPFRAETLAASVFKILSDNPERLSDALGIPKELDDVVFRALAKTESERFQSLSELRAALQKAAESAGVVLKPPALSEKDIVISRETGDAPAASMEPQVSQWSHVAAQADLLEELYQRGVAAFNAGNFAECVDKMSQVLDEVPVHSMSLHYLATSEEKLRRERLPEKDRKEAAAVLTAMRDAHRKGDAAAVIESANRLLALDKESMEARWYRRNAEARLRAVSVGVGAKERGAAARSVAGTTAKSFGYAPAKESRFHPGQKKVDVVPAAPASESPRGGKGVWILAGTGAVFLGLVGIWLSSFGGAKPRVEAREPALPGVRTSPFEGVDADGTVLLQVTRPAPTFSVKQVIPTSIPLGSATRVGFFGEGFSDALVVVPGPGASVLTTDVQNEGLLEVEILAEREGEILVEVINPQGHKETVRIQVEQP